MKRVTASAGTTFALTALAVAFCGVALAHHSFAPFEMEKDITLEGTVLDAQGEALKKARGVQDTLDAAAQRKMDEADAASQ